MASKRSRQSGINWHTNWLKEVTCQIGRAQDNLDYEVQFARHNRCTWADIGNALGTTRQAAQSRFRHITTDPPAQSTQTALADLNFALLRAQHVGCTNADIYRSLGGFARPLTTERKVTTPDPYDLAGGQATGEYQ